MNFSSQKYSLQEWPASSKPEAWTSAVHEQPLWVRGVESDKHAPKQTQARALLQSQAKGQSFWKQSRTAGKIRWINRIIQIWVWHSFLHVQMKKILGVSPRTRLNQLLAYFPCGPTAGNEDTSCLLVGAEWKQHRLGQGPARSLRAFHPVALTGVCAEITGAEVVMSLLSSLSSL